MSTITYVTKIIYVNVVLASLLLTLGRYLLSLDESMVKVRGKKMFKVHQKYIKITYLPK